MIKIIQVGPKRNPKGPCVRRQGRFDHWNRRKDGNTPKSLEHVTVTLFGKRIFADVIKVKNFERLSS